MVTCWRLLHFASIIYLSTKPELNNGIQPPIDDPKYYYNLGFAFSGLGKNEDAIKAYTKDIEKYNNYGALENRAFYYAKIGDRSQAISDYEKAHERIMEKIHFYEKIDDPRRKPYLKDLVRVQCYIGELPMQLQSFENARTYYQCAILNCERYPEVLPEELGMTLLYANSVFANMQLQDFDMAASDFAGSLKLSKSPVEKHQIEMSINYAGLGEAVKRHMNNNR